MDREIEQLIHNVLHAEVSEQDRDRLSAWVRASPGHARDYYRAVIDEQAIARCLDSTSIEEVSALADRSEDPLDLSDLAAAEDSAAATIVKLAPREVRSQTATSGRPNNSASHTKRPGGPVVSFAGVRVYQGRGGNLTLRRLLFAALLLLVAAVGLVVWVNSFSDQAIEVAKPEPDNPLRLEPAAPQARVAARITADQGVVWLGDGVRAVGDQLLVGDTIRIESGLLSLETVRGADITVQGPCTLTAVGDNRLRLGNGRLLASVPPAAQYFTVDTPTARLVDYGTEFGVEVDRSGRTEAAVFQGLIELSETDSADSENIAPTAQRKLRLTAGWSASVNTDGELQEQAVAFDLYNDKHFAHVLRAQADPVYRYRAAIMRSKPLAYWPLDAYENARINDHAEGGQHDLIRLGRVDLVAGVFGNAARFENRQGKHDYLLSAAPIDELTDADQYALSLWFKPASQHQGRLLGLAVDGAFEGRYAHAVVLETIDDTQHHFKQPAPANALRFLHRDPPGDDGMIGSNVYAEALTPGQWYHMVAVKHRDRVEIYLNGERRGTLAEAGRVRGTPDILLGISHQVLDKGQSFEPRQFRGLIDEVAVYDRPLTQEEIAEQYQLGVETDSIQAGASPG